MTGTMTTRGVLVLFLAVLCAVPVVAAAELVLPPGFTVQVYVTGEGFDTSERATRGVPSASTLAIDASGTLFLARTGRRYTGGDVDDLWPIYRVPPGGARMTKTTEPRFLYGPPLPSVQIAGLRAGRDVLVSTFDRDRKVGVIYVIDDGHAELLVGGTPPRGMPPLLTQPETAAVDNAGHMYVADRAKDQVVKLNARGAVVGDPLTLRRPRLLAFGGDGALWIAADGAADAPWQRGPGEIWRLAGDAAPALLLRGPVAAGMALAPTGQLFVADRQSAEIFMLGPDGTRVPFAKFTDGDAPRGLAIAPVTPATERAGIAGSLFVITISRGAWPVNEVVKISGPFEQFVREHIPAR
jgi:DNA-binding beta-propeller fold protein YncE